MKALSYNIQYGKGADERYDLARIAREIQGADVIALQEVDRYWLRSGMLDSPAVLSAHLPMHHWVFGANLDIDASEVHDDHIVHRRKQFGTMILSKWPILSSRNFPLPKWGDRQHHSIQQGLLEAVIETPLLGPVRVYSVHLSHLAPYTRRPQIELIKSIIERAPHEGGAWCGGHPDPEAGWLEEPEPPMPESWMLMGDMNFTPDSEEYASFVGGESPEYGRLTNRCGPLDTWCLAGHEEGSGSTHLGGDTRIDYCFVSGQLASRVHTASIDTAATGSDHYPIEVVFA